MAEGVVIGLRAMPLAAPADVDVTVSLAAVTDRLAREGGTTLPCRPVTVSVAWAAMAPPRGGWERVGAVTADEVYAVARQGIEEVASGAPGRCGRGRGRRPAQAGVGSPHDDHAAGARGRCVRGIRAGVLGQGDGAAPGRR